MGSAGIKRSTLVHNWILGGSDMVALGWASVALGVDVDGKTDKMRALGNTAMLPRTAHPPDCYSTGERQASGRPSLTRLEGPPNVVSVGWLRGAGLRISLAEGSVAFLAASLPCCRISPAPDSLIKVHAIDVGLHPTLDLCDFLQSLAGDLMLSWRQCNHQICSSYCPK